MSGMSSFSARQMAYSELMYKVMDELRMAEEKFPNQSLPWGGGPGRFWLITGPLGTASQIQRAIVDAELRNGTATWFDVIAEEFLEAGAETGGPKDPSDDPQAAHLRLKIELIQVAAMALRAIADMDSQREAYLKRMHAADSILREEYVIDDPYDSMKGGVSDADEWAAEVPPNAGSAD